MQSTIKTTVNETERANTHIIDDPTFNIKRRQSAGENFHMNDKDNPMNLASPRKVVQAAKIRPTTAKTIRHNNVQPILESDDE